MNLVGQVNYSVALATSPMHQPIEDEQIIRQARFQMLEDIARDLAGDICFPCVLDVSLQVRRTLQVADCSEAAIVAVTQLDPLQAASLIGLANRNAPAGSAPIFSLTAAIRRIGLPSARSFGHTLATEQLLASGELVQFAALSSLLWGHSLSCAAAARVLARHFTPIDPDLAALAGLVHDIGAFYMLHRATKYPELKSRPETLQYLIMQWHESIGESLLHALGLPEVLTEAIRDHDRPREAKPAPSTLSEVIFVANLLSGAIFEWQRNDVPEKLITRPELDNPAYLALFDEIAHERQQMLASFANLHPLIAK